MTHVTHVSQEWTLQMADLPESIANARVCAAKLLGLSMLPAKSDEPAFFSAVIDVSGMAAPLEVEPGSFALLAAAVTAQHGAFVVLSRASVSRTWSYVGLFAEEAALQVAQRLDAESI